MPARFPTPGVLRGFRGSPGLLLAGQANRRQRCPNPPLLMDRFTVLWQYICIWGKAMAETWRKGVAMDILLREYRAADTKAAIAIWNEVVQEGVAFPQLDLLDEETGQAFFSQQSHTGIACDLHTGAVAGLYILHPNNVGRCGHICNASYAVSKAARGQRIGEKLVKNSMEVGKRLGFRILQFNECAGLGPLQAAGLSATRRDSRGSPAAGWALRGYHSPLYRAINPRNGARERWNRIALALPRVPFDARFRVTKTGRRVFSRFARFVSRPSGRHPPV